MSFQSWLVHAAIAVMPIAAYAQQDHSGHYKQEPTAVSYQSAFANYKRYTEDDETPDIRWGEVNEEMGKLGGHAAHMKNDSVVPSQTIPAKAASKANAPVDHSKHH